MNLIDLYVEEVGEQLPAKMRADIQTEIRSLIEDTLEERAQATGREPDEAMIVDVLKEFGAPAKMAASYMPPRYLIGPLLLPSFFMVMRVVAVVIFVVTIIRFGVAAGSPGLDLNGIIRLAVEHVGSYFSILLTALGNVVFVFAFLEWAMPKVERKQEDWDPRSMKPRQEPERINPVGLIWGIGLSIVAILIFNVYPHLLGLWFVEDGAWTVVPFLTDAFFRYVPLMTAGWGLQIVLNIVLLRQGSWTPATRWLQVAIKVFGLVILALLIAGPAIVQFPFNATGLNMDRLEGLEELAHWAFRAGLLIALIVDGIEVAKMIYNLITKRDRPVLAG